MKRIKLYSLEEIKKALDDGKTVHWYNSLYHVVHDGSFLVVCQSNGYTTGLHESDLKSIYYLQENEK